MDNSLQSQVSESQNWENFVWENWVNIESITKAFELLQKEKSFRKRGAEVAVKGEYLHFCFTIKKVSIMK